MEVCRLPENLASPFASRNDQIGPHLQRLKACIYKTYWVRFVILVLWRTDE